jgi:hypothetical protein
VGEFKYVDAAPLGDRSGLVDTLSTSSKETDECWMGEALTGFSLAGCTRRQRSNKQALQRSAAATPPTIMPINADVESDVLVELALELLCMGSSADDEESNHHPLLLAGRSAAVSEDDDVGDVTTGSVGCVEDEEVFEDKPVAEVTSSDGDDEADEGEDDVGDSGKLDGFEDDEEDK